MISRNVPKLRFKEFREKWKKIKLEEIGKIYTGNTPSKKDKNNYGDEYPWIKPSDISENDNIIYKGLFSLSEKGYEKSRVVPKNSILVTCIASIGKNAIAGTKLSFNQQINAIIPQNNFDPYFLYVLSGKWSKTMEKLTSNASLKLVNKEEFGRIITTLPTLSEQQRIGNLFSKLDHLIDLHLQKLEQLKKLKRGYLKKMFPQKGKMVPCLRFSGFNGNWKEISLKDIGKIYTGNTPSKKDKDNYGNIHSWITPADISDDKNVIYEGATSLSEKGYKKARIVPKGSILITCIASLGKNIIAGQELSFNQQINAIVPSEEYNSYFLYFLSNQWSNEMMRLTSNASLKLVNKSDFGNITTLIPTTSEQEKIGDFFNNLDKKIKLENDKIEILSRQKKAYLQKMFI